MSHHDEHESHLARNLVIAGGAYLAGVALSNHMHRHPRRWVAVMVLFCMVSIFGLLIGPPDQNKEVYTKMVSSCSVGQNAYCGCVAKFMLSHTLSGEEEIAASDKACERLWINN